MYPLNTEMPWPENQWYVAAVSEEVGPTILGRTLLNRSVIMFRDDKGAAHALSGVCPHRMMPLEKGRTRRQPGDLRLSRPDLRHDRSLCRGANLIQTPELRTDPLPAQGERAVAVDLAR
jgi:hypothetical protein